MMNETMNTKMKTRSLYKFGWDFKAGRPSKQRVPGYYMTAIEYARSCQGGMRLIQHARRQPWETWHGRYLYG